MLSKLYVPYHHSAHFGGLPFVITAQSQLMLQMKLLSQQHQLTVTYLWSLLTLLVLQFTLMQTQMPALLLTSTRVYSMLM